MAATTRVKALFLEVRLVAVAECGTHAVVDAVLGPVATGEQTLAGQLISRLAPGMLVLADRNFVQLSGLAAGLSDRGGAAVAGLGQAATADPARTTRWLLPIRAD